MKITGAEFKQGRLMLNVENAADALRFLYGFKPGEYEIRHTREKRSLSANAYAWRLINLIAEKLMLSPQEVYRQELQYIPGVYEWIMVQDDAVDGLRKVWNEGHLGRRIDTEPSTVPGMVNAYMFYGSSDFDKRQMSILIDHLADEATELGIETRSEEEIKSIMEAWE